MKRRVFLTALVGGAIGLVAGEALAAGPTSHVRTVTRDERGVTLFLELDHAPFPAASAWYRDNTVIVFVPHHVRIGRGERVSAVVHFHGHNSMAEPAMIAHQLREQLFDSKQNAILVVPQGPMMAADSSAGKLDAPGGLARLLTDVLLTLQTPEAVSALGPSAIRAGARIGTVCLSAHSGGYHAAACSVRDGGVEVNEVYLFDALYAEADVFRDWVVRGKGKNARNRHKLVSYYGVGSTEAQSLELLADLQKAGVSCAYERVEGTLSRQAITREDAVFIRTGLAHGAVTHELNALRDCLYASGLTRRLRTAWFDSKGGSRRLERR